MWFRRKKFAYFLSSLDDKNTEKMQGASLASLAPSRHLCVWRDSNEEAPAKVDRYSHHFERNDGALSKV